MASIEETFAQAVEIALGPSSDQASRQQAYTFLEQVKSNALEVWPQCFGLFLDKANYQPQTRLTALQIVDEAIGNGVTRLDEAALGQIRQGMMEYIQREFVEGHAEGSDTYLRNKMVQTLFLLFLQTYGTSWPDCFTYLISLITVQPATATSTAGASNYNLRTTDLLLRFLHELSTEISDVSLRLNKPFQRITRDSAMRDAIRTKDAPQIANAVFSVLADALTGITQPTSEGTFKNAEAMGIAESALRVVADYTGWIDINLIVTAQTLPMLFQSFTLPQLPVRLATADVFIEVLAKGMHPGDKLQLLAALDLPNVLVKLLEACDASRSASPSDSDEEHFREKLARLVNTACSEACKITEEASASDSDKQQAREVAVRLGSIATAFLSDEYDDTATAVIPALASLLAIFKKEKKVSQHTHMTPEKQEFLSKLLRIVFEKMRYTSEEEWTGGDEEDEEAANAFADVRKNLKILSDAVAWITPEVFTEVASTLLTGVLDAVDAGGPKAAAVTWQQAELALHVLYNFGEALRSGTSGAPAFVQISIAEKTKAKKEDKPLDYRSYPIAPLGQMLIRTIQSNMTAFPHPSVPLQFFECINRYHELFSIWPEMIPLVLGPFLDSRGLHHTTQHARLRCFYLFQRFLFYNKEQLARHLTDEHTSQIMASILPLLEIQAKLVPSENGDRDLLSNSVSVSGIFDSQLSLFDAVGTLAYVFNSRPAQQKMILDAVLTPLLQGVKNTRPGKLSTAQDLLPLLTLHHYFLAVAALAKGFPVLTAKSNTANGIWAGTFTGAAPVLIEALRPVKGIKIVREAALAAFKVMASAVGSDILPSVSLFIETVGGELTPIELIEFLNFLGMLLVKYKESFAPLLDVLVNGIFSRVYASLQEPIQGTDDQTQHSDLARAYFNLISSIFSAGCQGVLLSERNKPNLETCVNSIVHFCNDARPLEQKAGFIALIRIAQTWVAPVAAVNGVGETIPGLEQFFYSSVTPLCFQIPRKSTFDYGDAQSYTALGEMATCIRALYEKRGDEFISVLGTTILPTAGATPEQIQEFCLGLTGSPDAKAFRKVFAPFVQKIKQQAPLQ